MKQAITIAALWISFIMLSLNLYSQVTVTIKPGPAEGKDAYVNSYYERLGDTQSFIAAAWTYDGIEGTGRSFIEFNLPALPDSLNNFQAFLSLYYNPTSSHVGHGGDNVCKLERVIEPWTESGIAWYHQPAVTNQNAVIIPASVTSDQSYPDIDVTQLVLDMYAHPDSSFGFRLSLIDEIIYRSMILASSDHQNPDLWPSLVLKYDVPCNPPVAGFKHVNFNSAVQFIADSADNGEYWWSFGNGFYSDIKSPAYIYTEPGSYNVCLTISNGCGADTTCQTIEICEEEVFGSYTYRTEGNFAEFTPSVLSHKVEYLWDFGDGFFSELEKPIHYYNQPGKYLACLIAKNYCNQIIHCDSITIESPPQAPENKSTEVIQLFPNPTSGLISINNGGKPVELKSVHIVNFDGTVIINESNWRLKKQTDGYFCDFTGLESGIYVIHVLTDVGVFTQKAVVIQDK